MAPQASKKYCLLLPEHHRLVSYTSTGINSEQVPRTFSLLHDGIPFYVGIGIRRKHRRIFL